MPETQNCPQCAAPLPGDGWEGLCPRCLVRLSLKTAAPGSKGGMRSAETRTDSPLPDSQGRDPEQKLGAQDQGPSRRPVHTTTDGGGTSFVRSGLSTPHSPSGRRFGDYELLEEIARGGMGVVYKARQVRLKRLVAIKMMLSGDFVSPEFVQRFRLEAEAAANLDHPNIVAIHEVGEYEGEHYYSMDYVDGQTLAERAQNNPLPPELAAEYLKTIAEAIHYAHQHGILHRDLKPSNVLIDSLGQPHVTDFGLAKRLSGDSGLTRTGQVLGSPNFMPPEQALGKRHAATVASDVYSLGAILYFLLTGRPPFVGVSGEAILAYVIYCDPTAPRALHPEVPRDLETICLKCLEKDARRRYGTAQELVEELGRFLGGEPILARPVSQAARVWRWCRRKPMVSSLGALSLSLLLAVAVGAPIAALRINREKQQATEKLWDSYLAQARANRWSGRAGRRFESLDALRKAAQIRPQMELRNEAIACMVLPDLRLLRPWHGNRADPGLVSVDANLRLCARSDPRGDIVVRRLADDGPVAQFKLSAARVWLVRLSPDGKLLAAEYRIKESGPDVLSVWTVETQTRLWELPGGVFEFAVDFSPDSRYVAAGAEKGSILVYDLVGARAHQRFPIRAVPYSLRFSPDSRRLAVCCRTDPAVEVLNVESGQAMMSLTHAQGVCCAEWHPGGNLLATACQDRQVYVWDLANTQRLAVLQGHAAPPASLAFNHRGDWLASSAPDDALYLWEPPSARPLVRLPRSAAGLQFSANDDQILITEGAPELGLVEVARPRECRVLRSGAKRARLPGADFSRDGRMLAAMEPDGVRLWDTRTARELAFVPFLGGHSVILHPDGRSLIGSGNAGVYRWPIERQAQTNAVCLQVGRPEQLEPPAPFRQAVLSPDGKRLAVRRTEGILLLRLDNGERQNLRQYSAEYESLNFSVDGQWLAATAWPEDEAKIWSVETGQFVQGLRGSDIVNLAFSPDSHWLVTCGFEEYRFWEVGSWQQRRAMSRLRVGRSVGPLVLIRAGALMAVSAGEFGVELLEADTGKALAVLDQSEQLPVCFSLNGENLVTIDSSGANYLWDLRLIREQLAAMKLDWDSPSLPPLSPKDNEQPLTVTVLGWTNGTLGTVREAQSLEERKEK